MNAASFEGYSSGDGAPFYCGALNRANAQSTVEGTQKTMGSNSVYATTAPAMPYVPSMVSASEHQCLLIRSGYPRGCSYAVRFVDELMEVVGLNA